MTDNFRFGWKYFWASLGKHCRQNYWENYSHSCIVTIDSNLCLHGFLSRMSPNSMALFLHCGSCLSQRPAPPSLTEAALTSAYPVNSVLRLPTAPVKMIKLYQAKSKSKEDSNKKTCAAQLRINKDVNELELPPGCEIDFAGELPISDPHSLSSSGSPRA